MHAVVGMWEMDLSLKERQDEALPGIMEGVRSRPGFVHGYWTSDAEDSSVNVSFVVWESRERAEEFRQSVLGNAAAQLKGGIRNKGLRIVQVDASA
jgi:heme-degrading monooxygenase HmoA